MGAFPKRGTKAKERFEKEGRRKTRVVQAREEPLILGGKGGGETPGQRTRIRKTAHKRRKKRLFQQKKHPSSRKGNLPKEHLHRVEVFTLKKRGFRKRKRTRKKKGSVRIQGGNKKGEQIRKKRESSSARMGFN